MKAIIEQACSESKPWSRAFACARVVFVYAGRRFGPRVLCFSRFGADVLLRGAGVLARPFCLPVSRSPPVGRSVAPVGRLVCRSVSQSVGRPGWSVGRSVGRLVGGLVGGLVGLNQP